MIRSGLQSEIENLISVLADKQIEIEQSNDQISRQKEVIAKQQAEINKIDRELNHMRQEQQKNRSVDYIDPVQYLNTLAESIKQIKLNYQNKYENAVKETREYTSHTFQSIQMQKEVNNQRQQQEKRIILVKKLLKDLKTMNEQVLDKTHQKYKLESNLANNMQHLTHLQVVKNRLRDSFDQLNILFVNNDENEHRGEHNININDIPRAIDTLNERISILKENEEVVQKVNEKSDNNDKIGIQYCKMVDDILNNYEKCGNIQQALEKIESTKSQLVLNAFDRVCVGAYGDVRVNGRDADHLFGGFQDKQPQIQQFPSQEQNVSYVEKTEKISYSQVRSQVKNQDNDETSPTIQFFEANNKDVIPDISDQQQDYTEEADHKRDNYATKFPYQSSQKYQKHYILYQNEIQTAQIANNNLIRDNSVKTAERQIQYQQIRNLQKDAAIFELKDKICKIMTFIHNNLAECEVDLTNNDVLYAHLTNPQKNFLEQRNRNNECMANILHEFDRYKKPE